jgi:hypothetical protein
MTDNTMNGAACKESALGQIKCYGGKDERNGANECKRAREAPTYDENSLLASKSQKGEQCLVGRNGGGDELASQIRDPPDHRRFGAQTASQIPRQDLGFGGSVHYSTNCAQFRLSVCGAVAAQSGIEKGLTSRLYIWYRGRGNHV